MTRRCLIFAHFDKDGGLKPNVVDLLGWYRRQVAKIIFVSTSPVSESDRETLALVCDSVIERENTGYDFVSWKLGLSFAEPHEQFDEIVLANDSVTGPLLPADNLIDRVSALPCDVTGLVASWERGWHLQSWYVCYKRSAFTSDAFRQFWASVQPVSSKQTLIDDFEIGMARAMRAAGLKLCALYEPPEKIGRTQRFMIWLDNLSFSEWSRSTDNRAILKRIETLNPTHFMWAKIIRKGIPFIKRELIESNPYQLNIHKALRRFPQLRKPS